jgi:hypothetical protein
MLAECPTVGRRVSTYFWRACFGARYWRTVQGSLFTGLLLAQRAGDGEGEIWLAVSSTFVTSEGNAPVVELWPPMSLVLTRPPLMTLYTALEIWLAW